MYIGKLRCSSRIREITIRPISECVGFGASVGHFWNLECVALGVLECVGFGVSVGHFRNIECVAFGSV